MLRYILINANLPVTSTVAAFLPADHLSKKLAEQKIYFIEYYTIQTLEKGFIFVL